MFLVVIGAIGKSVKAMVLGRVDFSGCVVAPPGERSVGAANGKRCFEGSCGRWTKAARLRSARRESG